MSDTISISKQEYFSLLCAAEKLSRLENGGVDNWEWYSESIYGSDMNDQDYEEWENDTRIEVFGS